MPPREVALPHEAPKAEDDLIYPRTSPCDGAPRSAWAAGFWERSMETNMCWASNKGCYFAECQGNSGDVEWTQHILALRAMCQTVLTTSIRHGESCPLFPDILGELSWVSGVLTVVVEFHSGCSEVVEALCSLWWRGWSGCGEVIEAFVVRRRLRWGGVCGGEVERRRLSGFLGRRCGGLMKVGALRSEYWGVSNEILLWNSTQFERGRCGIWSWMRLSIDVTIRSVMCRLAWRRGCVCKVNKNTWMQLKN